MLDLGRYLLGAAEIGLLAGFAVLGASRIRGRLLPDFSGAPAHLATAVLALAILVWAAELLGTLGLFEPLPYLVAVAGIGIGVWAVASPVGGVGVGWTRRARRLWSASPHPHPRIQPCSGAARRAAEGTPPRRQDPRAWRPRLSTLIALAIAVAALIHFAAGVRLRLSTGMTGFDSTWYHGPFAAGFFQTGNTWDLHFIAPQFLAWFYPANAEIFHGIGMLAFDRDVLSPLLNLGWFVGCLVAVWCIGRPFGLAPWSLTLGAIALSVPALSDQAGEARNDIVGLFFLLAAVAIALNGAPNDESAGHSRGLPVGALIVAGLAVGLAAGTKLNFLPPAAVFVVGLALIAPTGARWRALAATGFAALAGGGYWYLRNLIHSGNPLPWVDGIGPISLPAPEQALGGREGHSVFGYLADGSVWSDWFLPGLHDGLWLLWPLLLAAALAGLLLCFVPARTVLPQAPDEPRDRLPGANWKARAIQGDQAVLRVAALVGLAAILAWLIAPTSASGPDGIPRGFESGLRYLAPALVLGLALLPVVWPAWLRRAGAGYPPNGRILKVPVSLDRHLSGRGIPRARLATAALAIAVAVAIGYPVQRHYLESRYSDPSFTTSGLNATFAWSRDISDARIATTSTRQYPLFGTDLSNRVNFVGIERPPGGFEAPATCRQWRRLLNEGDYDYVVTSRDRIEPGKPPYPSTARWTAGPWATVILRTPPTVVYELRSPLDPSACRR